MRNRNRGNEMRSKNQKKQWGICKSLVAPLLGLLLISCGFYLVKSRRSDSSLSALENPARKPASSIGKIDSASTGVVLSSAANLPPKPGIAKSLQSLHSMAKTLAEFSKPEAHIKDLVQSLQFQEQEPVVTRNQNPDTGEMLIVRTQKPLDGTRYFHAQYFSDESGKGFVQHMSFEFQPGPDAMKQATLAVEKSFPDLGIPQTQTNDFVSWNLDENHILWIKQLNARDLEEDPFNAYSPEDVGTVRVAVELEIHGGSEHHH